MANAACVPGRVVSGFPFDRRFLSQHENYLLAWWAQRHRRVTHSFLVGHPANIHKIIQPLECARENLTGSVVDVAG